MIASLSSSPALRLWQFPDIVEIITMPCEEINREKYICVFKVDRNHRNSEACFGMEEVGRVATFSMAFLTCHEE